MEVDDSSEKVRRNLVIFSFGIVVSSFLNLSIDKKGKIFSGLDLTSISPFKFWVVIIFVLIYLFYRYWFDDKTNNAIAIFNAEFSSNKYAYIRRLLNDDIANSLLSIKKPKFINNFEELNESHIVQNNKEYGKPVSVDSIASPSYVNDDSWNGTIGSAYSIKWNGNSYEKSGGMGYSYNIPLFSKYCLRLKVIFKIVTYSKSITELITPIILFGLALFICLFELAQIVFK